MAVNWPEGVPNKFYGMQRTPENNTLTTEFESGKKRYILKNSSPKITFSVMLDLKSKTEELLFWNWYKDVLLSRTQTVMLPDFLEPDSETEKEYRMIEEPSAEGLLPKTFTFNFKEE